MRIGLKMVLLENRNWVSVFIHGHPNITIDGSTIIYNEATEKFTERTTVQFICVKNANISCEKPIVAGA